jgi:hypothetical protein
LSSAASKTDVFTIKKAAKIVAVESVVGCDAARRFNNMKTAIAVCSDGKANAMMIHWSCFPDHDANSRIVIIYGILMLAIYIQRTVALLFRFIKLKMLISTAKPYKEL